MPQVQRQSAVLHAAELPGPRGAGGLLDALTKEPSPAVLESSALHSEFGRYSLFACRPLRVLEVRDGALSDETGEILAQGRGLWRALDDILMGISLAQPSPAVPYVPGWIGYIGYEMGRTIERLPARAPRDVPLPDLHLALYDALLIYDAVETRWTLVELRFDDPPAGAGLGAEALRSCLSRAEGCTDPAPAPTEHADARHRDLAVQARSDFQPDEYRRAVARCVEYIAAGDIFQVNLSQRFVLPDAPQPAALYRHLRRRNPAWYAAYLHFASQGREFAILSSSPELFLRCRAGRVTTRPIKGTRPRVGQVDHDAAAAAELLGSEKDNAELAMIIDLLRNDLGRVCRYGTVRVAEPCRLETHPTVFHLVGTVTGRLCEGVGPAGLLRATFPGGSITGAPKIRAMEIIDELEPVARGVYTGCIGIVGVNGEAEWNIAIRTILHHAGKVYLQVGGGIVADSTPDGEYRETLDKARAMLEALAEASVGMLPAEPS
ncbi:MAG: aminodeoxychorismate synthase component I [Phycisphaerae bacterium]|nr:aminodeoxychorismate synthase component I [Phycisphaerae bacterium]